MKEEILKKFLEKGMNIDKESLDFFSKNPEKLEKFFEKLEKEKKSVLFVTKELVFSILKEERKLPVIEELIPSKKEKREKISVSEIENFLIKRYENFRKFFHRRLEIINPVSINKIGKNKKFSIICMVRERDGEKNAVVVEDLTGEIKVFLKKDEFKLLFEDEIIAILCRKNEEIVAEKIYWPDVPLKRTIPKTNSKIACFFLSNLYLWEDESVWEKIVERINRSDYEKKYVFLLEKVFDHKLDVEEFLRKFGEECIPIGIGEEYFGVKNLITFQPPTLLKLEGKIRILISDKKTLEDFIERWGDMKGVEIMLNVLRKRHLSPKFKIEKMGKEERLFIKEVPDIFVAPLERPGVMNYKGITIVCNGSVKSQPIFFGIDLQNRETIKINLLK